MTPQAIARRRRPRRLHPRRTGGEPKPKRLPKYLEADEIDALIRAAPNSKARLVFLVQWRARLRVVKVGRILNHRGGGKVLAISLGAPDWHPGERCARLRIPALEVEDAIATENVEETAT